MSERLLLAVKIGALLIVILAAASQAPEGRITEIRRAQPSPLEQ